MSVERVTYRHRNSKNSWAAADRIHTFWVGQRVARSWERKNFIDLIGEEGVVVGLPSQSSRTLTIRLESGETARWTPTESIPVRALIEANRKRFAACATSYSDQLRSLDDNGFPVSTTTEGKAER